MTIILFLLSVGLFGAFFISLFKPTIFLKNGTRIKSLLFFFIPSIILMVIATKLNSSNHQEDWKNPEGVERLSLSYKKLDSLPLKLKEFQDLKSLNLSHNNLSELNKDILISLPNLKELDLSDNPISELPEWISELKLEKLEVNNTSITKISENTLKNINTIEYTNTPLENANKAKKEQEKKEAADEQKGESLSQYAIRNILGKDYGYSKKFKKGELYYTKSVSKEKVEELGKYLTEQGYFNDDKEVAMQITYNDKKDVEAYELRAIYAGTGKPEEGTTNLFTTFAMHISLSIFEGKAVHFHLTDNEFKSLHIYKSKTLSL